MPSLYHLRHHHYPSSSQSYRQTFSSKRYNSRQNKLPTWKVTFTSISTKERKNLNWFVAVEVEKRFFCGNFAVEREREKSLFSKPGLNFAKNLVHSCDCEKLNEVLFLSEALWKRWWLWKLRTRVQILATTPIFCFSLFFPFGSILRGRHDFSIFSSSTNC